MSLRSTLPRLIVALPVGLAVAFSGCGGGGSPTATSAVTANAAIPDGAPFIDQESLAFHPEKLTVKAGEKVYFQNSESSLHTVTINGKNESGNMKRRELFVWTAGAVGGSTASAPQLPPGQAGRNVNASKTVSWVTVGAASCAST